MITVSCIVSNMHHVSLTGAAVVSDVEQEFLKPLGAQGTMVKSSQNWVTPPLAEQFIVVGIYSIWPSCVILTL